MKVKTGNVDTVKTVRAGCGLRYDPEQLGEDTGFDFSAATLFASKNKTELKEKAGAPKCLKNE